jgi:hypothetical protein
MGNNTKKRAEKKVIWWWAMKIDPMWSITLLEITDIDQLRIGLLAILSSLGLTNWFVWSHNNQEWWLQWFQKSIRVEFHNNCNFDRNLQPRLGNWHGTVTGHCSTKAHCDVMYTCIRYVCGTPTHGLIVKLTGTDKPLSFNVRKIWFKLCNESWELSECQCDNSLFVVSTMFSSLTQRHVMLFMTETEFVTVLALVRDMMYIYHVVKYMGLTVDLSMLVELDNKLDCLWKNTSHGSTFVFPQRIEGRRHCGIQAHSSLLEWSRHFCKECWPTTLHKEVTNFCCGAYF